MPDGMHHRRPATATRRIAVIAHRGSSEEVAEHTLAAYRKAIADGADALECDVRLTRDGVLVCVHDRRVDRTSNGRGPVSTLELADLAELDFASWRRRDLTRDPLLTGDWEEPDHDQHRVLTLERLLQLVVDAGRHLELAIETKHPTRYSGLVERELVALLRRFGLVPPPGSADPSKVRVMSFAVTGLRRVHSLAPTIPTVFLMNSVPLRFRDGSLPSGVPIAGPSIGVLRRHPGYVARVHSRGHRVHVWTVDCADDIDLAIQLGVDAIITNRPRRVLRRLSEAAGVGAPETD